MSNIENININETIEELETLNKEINENAEFIAQTEAEIMKFMIENNLSELELPNGEVIKLENKN
jgi:hypothetical protein